MHVTHLVLWSVLVSIAAAKTCRSTDVRNTVEMLSVLKDCHIIEGFLQVVLIDKSTEESFANYSFPLLREVTDFVIFFRVNGITSIRKLFPNLSVIRGEKLAMDYALILNRLPNLKEINLPSLAIVRGGVAIGKNDNLCYANTIDWDRVATDSSSHLIFSNGDKAKCQNCSQQCGNRCWNHTTCQTELEWTSPEGDECDKQCLVGCTGRGPYNCTACKHVNYQGKCILYCPKDTYLYRKRYCISETECNSPDYHLNIMRMSPNRNASWFTFNRTCLFECPHGYQRDAAQGCSPCGALCKKVCDSSTVNSLQDAQTLRDCTLINGSLTIQISNGKPAVVAKELENSLGRIEEINGYLKIARSFPLVNLNFLKNLKIIHGRDLKGFTIAQSMVVLDNQNLQDFWDWQSRPLGSTFKIARGRPFFHHNPKLCMKHIEKLMYEAGVREVTEIEVASNSNGDQFACRVINLSVSVHLKYSNSVILRIIKPSDMKFIRYIAFYKKSSAATTLPYSGDECGENGWNMNDVLDSYETTTDNNNGSVYHSINRLEPDTAYAFYVATYTVESTGAQSPMQVVRTLPSQPEMPTGFMAHSNSSNQIVLRWDPPLKPNGQITKYLISGVLARNDPSLLIERDYCKMAIPNKTIEIPTRPPKFETFMKPSDDCCDVNEKTMNQSVLMCETEDKSLPKIPIQTPNDCSQFWYDLVLNTSIAHNTSQLLRKRSATYEIDDGLYFLNDSNIYENNELVSFKRTVGEDMREITIRDVKHYSQFILTIRACRELYDNEFPDGKNCSQKAIEYVFTLPDPNADNIEGGLSVTTYNKTAKLSWKKPTGNGAIVSYDIELLRKDVANAFPHVSCVRSMHAESGVYELHGLAVGDYSVRIKAVSLSEFPFGKYTGAVEFSITEYSVRSFIVAVLVLLVTLILVGLSVGLMYYYKYKHMSHPILITSVNPEYCGVVFDDDWELPRERVKVIKELKRGNFGIVCEGLLAPEDTTVAVKKVIESASVRDVATFMNEALVMQKFTNCHHIVRLIGVVSKEYPQLVVMEMMAKGDLKSFLREARDNTPPSPAQMCLMATQIADGMAYLEAAKFVHRDLAARNCMVSAEGVVKIGDFGMTRDVYETDYYRKGNKGLLPIRWMSPESLNDGIFSSKSDAWSYGIVLWEIVTLASQPYQGMSNEQVLQYVISGNKLELPPVYPKRFKPIMFWCWKWKPKFRPSFLQILMEFEDYMTLQFRHTSYYHTPEGVQAREVCLNTEQEDVELTEVARKAEFTRTNGHPHS